MTTRILAISLCILSFKCSEKQAAATKGMIPDCFEIEQIEDADSTSLHATWSLIGYYDGDTTWLCKPDTLREMTLVLHQDHSLLARSSCNNMTASYAKNGKALTLTDVAVTEMYCTDSLVKAWEKVYVNTLRDATILERDQFYIFIGSGKARLWFDALPENE